MGYQITSKVLVEMGGDHATERVTDDVWHEILRRADVVRPAYERELPGPTLALGRKERAEIPQPLADLLADALDDMLTRQEILEHIGDGGTLDRDTARRVIYILRAGGVILQRIASPLAGDDAHLWPSGSP
jgi:hypothetical protein